MKKCIMIMVVMAACNVIYAQQPDTVPPVKSTQPITRDTALKDYVSMQAGQMIMIQNEKVGRMTKDMTMSNGTTVTTTGTVKTTDGHSFQLKEGDRVYMNGLIEGLAKPQKD